MEDLQEAKRRLRAEAKARRDALDPAGRRAAAIRIGERVTEHPAFRAAARLALYAEIGSEVSVVTVEEAALGAGKEVFYPRVEGRGLAFVKASREALSPGVFGIPEPSGPALDPASIELYLVPGVAFDLRRHRLGYGKGFYDRALARAPRAFKVGLCFDSQILPALPVGPHDQALDLVVTEARIL